MSHTQQDTFENRKHFQLERIILFSDAVFAIAITLLILEIKIPEIDNASAEAFENIMVHAALDFTGFILSFVVIGLFWVTHHRMFTYIADYDARLLWLNLHVLFWIVVMPFSTHLNMQFGNRDIVWFLYSMNLAGVSFALLMIWRHVIKHKNLTYATLDKSIIKFGRMRSLSTMLIFIIGGSLTFLPWEWVKWVSRFFFFLIFPTMAIIKKKYNTAIRQ